MATYGPGISVIANREVQPDPAELTKLQPGDLVFFQTDALPGIDHSGIYLGVDSQGKRRLISSRGEPDGPTMGDIGRMSVLDGNSPLTRGLRTARRI